MDTGQSLIGVSGSHGHAPLNGLFGQLRSCNYDIAKFRAQATLLPRDAQELIDRAVLGVGRDRLTLVSDMIDAGMVYNLPNWMSVLILTSRRNGAGGNAKQTMVPKARGERFAVLGEEYSVPIPCTWADWSFHIREIAAAERAGTPLDPTHAAEATIAVNNRIEHQALNGLGFNYRTHSAPGFLTSPLNTTPFVSNEAWTASGHDGQDIKDDIDAMIEALHTARRYGPYNLYVPQAYMHKLGDDFKAASDASIFARVTELPYGGRPINIKVLDFLPADTVLMIEMKPTTADVIVGQQPAPLNWQDPAGFEEFHMVLACMLTRVKTDIDGQQGWVVGTPSGA